MVPPGALQFFSGAQRLKCTTLSDVCSSAPCKLSRNFYYPAPSSASPAFRRGLTDGAHASSTWLLNCHGASGCSPLYWQSISSCSEVRTKQKEPQKRQKGNAGRSTGAELIYKAKWDVYKRHGTETAEPWGCSSHAGNPEEGALELAQGECHLRRGIVGNTVERQRPSRLEGRALLRRLWEQQGQLSPTEAANAAYFLALRKNPPEGLLQQLTACVLHKQPERHLSTLGMHRQVICPLLLRVFSLCPGVAERSTLVPLSSVVERRVGLLRLGALQLLLTDFAAIYTPEFLPLFTAAAGALRRCQDPCGKRSAPGQEEAAELQRGSRAGVMQESASNTWRRGPWGANGPQKGGPKEGLTALQAAFLLHAFGRTDLRDSALFSELLETVDAALMHLLKEEFPERPQTAELFTCLEAPEQLNGEALVMCLKGLANLHHKPSKEQLRRMVDVLGPYLLNEEPSVLGHASAPRKLPLLFGALSALSRLDAGPLVLRRLLQAACCFPLAQMGPYEPCDLLTAAVALQPIVKLAPECATAAVARIETVVRQGTSPEGPAAAAAVVAASFGTSACPARSSTAAMAAGSEMSELAVARAEDAALDVWASPGDPWASLRDSCLPPSSPFLSAAYCYVSAVGVGLAALRPALFQLHPAFRISVISLLSSLDAILHPDARPPRRIPMEIDGTGPLWQQQNAADERDVDLRAGETSRKTGTKGKEAELQEDAESEAGSTMVRLDSPAATDSCMRKTWSSAADASRSPAAGISWPPEPLHPLLRGMLQSIFYRLPCVSLRLLVELLESLRACDFNRREQREKLLPHGKTQRWHRPLMAVVAREGTRKIHQSTPDSLIRFLVLFYGELDGYSTSLDPLVYGLQRLAAVASYESLPHAQALRQLLLEALVSPSRVSILHGCLFASTFAVSAFLCLPRPLALAF
ncbi:uncharacterized protein LOC34620661 [Cyclospora cayetanensis]|uniref:Uncharacterized protein LOC34620661 n=1 Tax=Cyclospora cayetanensis TaxID=88456 RepID=A0A6P6S0U2_9EIME|nr:uncharacterized protein LOC34620661 [Cyclospora cayetanensis]